MGEGVSVATIEEIEELWYELSRELVASGTVERFQATVIDNDGESSVEDVVRIGNFNAVAEGQYLTYLSKRGAYETLPRQPGRYLDGTYDIFDEDSGFVQFAVDPTGPQGGALLVNLISLPSFFEQIQYGRITGYTIILLFLIAIGVFGWRFYALFTINGAVKKQAAGESAAENPLSRIFAVADQNKTDTETLELKLAEQILIERAEIDQYIWVVRLISVISPLLGLFGTIIGMINTFQAITLFGTGDPKTMAGGISEALVTTMLGLMCAIPATFMAAALSNYSKGIHMIRSMLISKANLKIKSNLELIRVSIAIAPLLGLFGTIVGMIEVFHILAVTGGGDAKAMAGGVARSTIPAMAGLMAAIPASIAARWLEQNARKKSDLVSEHLTYE